jgi:hypothetical protein
VYTAKGPRSIADVGRRRPRVGAREACEALSGLEISAVKIGLPTSGTREIQLNSGGMACRFIPLIFNEAGKLTAPNQNEYG